MTNKKVKRRSKVPFNIYAGGGWAGLTGAQKGGVISGGIGVVTNALKQAQIADTTGIESSISQQNNSVVEANSNESLLDEWANYSNLDRVKEKDLRMGSVGGGMLSGAGTGAAAGAALGPIGALAGAGIGAAVSGIGSLIGRKRANNKAQDLNKDVEAANLRRLSGFQNKAMGIDKMNDQNLMAGYFVEGGDLNNGVSFIDEGGTHEQNPLRGVPMGMGENGKPNLVEEGEVKFKDYIFSNRLYADKETLEATGLGNKYANHSFAKIAESLSKESRERPNDPISKRGLLDNMTKLTQVQEQYKMKTNKNNKSNQFAWGDMLPMRSIDGKVPGYPDYMGGVVGGFAWPGYGDKTPNLTSMNTELDTTLDTNKLNAKVEDNEQYVEGNSSSGQGLNASMLRYAPVVGSGIGVLTDIFGVTNKPDYRNADMALGSYKPVSAQPLGDYMSYNPLDRDYYTNKLNKQSASTRDTIINTSGGNRATAMAGLLSADRNSQDAMGDLFRRAEEFNLGQKEKVKTFNRGTNQYNSESALRADSINNQMRMDASRTSATLRDREKERTDSARSVNLTNFFDNLGGIGKESATKEMINSNPAYYYEWIRNKMGYKGEGENQAYGGNLKTKKRR